MNKVSAKVREFLSYSSSGVASPGGTTFFETSDIPLAKVMEPVSYTHLTLPTNREV